MVKRIFMRALLAGVERLSQGRTEHLPGDEAPLLRLTEEISAVLKPVKPLPSFREELSQRLALAASDRIVVETRRRWRGPILWGALGSLISLIGVLVYLLYSRLSRHLQSAA